MGDNSPTLRQFSALEVHGKITQTIGQQTGDHDVVIYSTLASKADLESPAFTGIPTAPTAGSGTNTTQIATTQFVNSEVNRILAATDAMLFKGTIGAQILNPTVTALPNPPYDAGWTYKVVSGGDYAGKTCEAGDLIICVKDRASGATGSNDDWTVVQTNIDGAVTGPASAVDGRIPLFNGSSGKVIKASDYTPSSFASAGHNHDDRYLPIGTDFATINGTSVKSSSTFELVPQATTVNGYPLSSNISLDNEDVGALSNLFLGVASVAGPTPVKLGMLFGQTGIGGAAGTVPGEGYYQAYCHDGIYLEVTKPVNQVEVNLVTPKINGYVLGAACAKGVDTSITVGSQSSNVPTTAAVAAFVGASSKRATYTVTLTAAGAYVIPSNVTSPTTDLGFAPKIVQVYDADGNQIAVRTDLTSNNTVTLRTTASFTPNTTWTVNILGW